MEPGWGPINFGQDFHNGIDELAYWNLWNYLEMCTTEPFGNYDLMQQLPVVDERILKRFRVDMQHLSWPITTFSIDIVHTSQQEFPFPDSRLIDRLDLIRS